MNDNPGGGQDSPAQNDVSRRGVLGHSAAGLAALACALGGCATGPKMPGNLPKMQAQYQDHWNGLAHCGICKHFISPNACEVVAAPVQADGWCKYYTIF